MERQQLTAEKVTAKHRFCSFFIKDLFSKCDQIRSFLRGLNAKQINVYSTSNFATDLLLKIRPPKEQSKLFVCLMNLSISG